MLLILFVGSSSESMLTRVGMIYPLPYAMILAMANTTVISLMVKVTKSHTSYWQSLNSIRKVRLFSHSSIEDTLVRCCK
jgi:hypothetical protein